MSRICRYVVHKRVKGEEQTIVFYNYSDLVEEVVTNISLDIPFSVEYIYK